MTKNVDLTSQKQNQSKNLIDEYILSSSAQDILIVPVYRDEIPFTSNIGLLDWRLYGLFSHLFKDRHLQGEAGEFLFLPIQHHHGLRNILCVGMGSRIEKSSPLSALTKQIAEKVSKLKIQTVYIMDSFFDDKSNTAKDEQMKVFSKQFKQETRWIVQ